MPVIVEQGANSQRSQTLVLGSGLTLGQTAEGLPLVSAGASSSADVVVTPSGGDDTTAIRNAMWQGKRVRLASGVFNVSGVIDVPEGVTVVGSGSGSGAQSGSASTRIVKADYPNPVFRFGDLTQCAGVESLRIIGPGKAIASGNSAIVCARSATGLPIARRLRFRDLHIEEVGEYGIYMKGCANVDIENVLMYNIGYNGVYASGGSALRLSTVRVDYSGGAFFIDGAAGVVLAACEAELGYNSFRLRNASEVVLDGCVSRKCRNVPMLITGGRSVILNGFRSDNTDAPYFVDQPHLRVEGGATGVQIQSITRTNSPLGTLTVEADVATAGARVLFGAHDFDPAKISSGGFFADIDATPRA